MLQQIFSYMPMYFQEEYLNFHDKSVYIFLLIDSLQRPSAIYMLTDSMHCTNVGFSLEKF